MISILLGARCARRDCVQVPGPCGSYHIRTQYSALPEPRHRAAAPSRRARGAPARRRRVAHVCLPVVAVPRRLTLDSYSTTLFPCPPSAPPLTSSPPARPSSRSLCPDRSPRRQLSRGGGGGHACLARGRKRLSAAGGRARRARRDGSRAKRQGHSQGRTAPGRACSDKGPKWLGPKRAAERARGARPKRAAFRPRVSGRPKRAAKRGTEPPGAQRGGTTSEPGSDSGLPGPSKHRTGLKHRGPDRSLLSAPCRAELSDSGAAPPAVLTRQRNSMAQKSTRISATARSFSRLHSAPPAPNRRAGGRVAQRPTRRPLFTEAHPPDGSAWPRRPKTGRAGPGRAGQDPAWPGPQLGRLDS